jgi:hypothetical protein
MRGLLRHETRELGGLVEVEDKPAGSLPRSIPRVLLQWCFLGVGVVRRVSLTQTDFRSERVHVIS